MHNGAMRSHTKIIRDVGEDAIAVLTGAPVLTVRSWGQRNSIPSKHWETLVSKEHCTADELMSAAAKRAA